MVPPSTSERTARGPRPDAATVSWLLEAIRSTGVPRLTQTVRAVAFWSAIVLPFLHIPLLVAGPSTRAEFFAFGGLVGLNLVALRLGYQHRPSRVVDGDRPDEDGVSGFGRN